MIKKTIGSGYKSNGDDILYAKSALSKLGLYSAPAYGITPYADQEMIGGIKKFQKSQNIPATGVIRPNDVTANALSKLSDDMDDEDFPGNSPIYRCPECGGPHGGSGDPGDDRCPDCRIKG